MMRHTTALLAVLLVAHMMPKAASVDSGVRFSRRTLLRAAAPTACASGAAMLLTNGYFRQSDPSHMHNQLVAATLANDAYPWTRGFGFSVIDVVDGLNAEQVARYQSAFTAKYLALGATSVSFQTFYSKDGAYAGHSAVIGTPTAVFLVFRGTADLGQGWSTAKISAVPRVVFNETLQLYQAPYHSVMGLWPSVVVAVDTALAATANPAAARVWVTGHSLGGASACLAALLLAERGTRIGGVYAFGPYKVGNSCGADTACWASVYDRVLADVTWAWWNNQDPVPALLDSALGTRFSSSAWSHVPRGRGWVRVVGDTCALAGAGPLNDVCPPEVDAADGAADGTCSRPLVEAHLPWVYLQKVARCALLTGPSGSLTYGSAGGGGSGDMDAARVDACGAGSVWERLLGLPAPRPGAAAMGRSQEASSGIALGDPIHSGAAVGRTLPASLDALLDGLVPLGWDDNSIAAAALMTLAAA